MTRRRYNLGDEILVSGLTFRIRAGTKRTYYQTGPDLLLEVATSRGWVKVGMGLAGFLTDFHCQHEDTLYPPFDPTGLPTPNAGREYFLDYLRKVIRDGWDGRSNGAHQ